MTIDLLSRALIPSKASSNPYDPGTVLFESSTPGIYNVELLSTVKCEVYCIGAGAGGNCTGGRTHGSHGGNWTSYGAGGGGGAGFVGEVVLNKGILSIKVGKAGDGFRGGLGVTAKAPDGEASQIGSFIIAGGGIGGIMRISTYGRIEQQTAGTGGTISVSGISVASSTLNSNGNNGSTSGGTPPGGASLYGGYGAGGQGFARGSSEPVTGLPGTNGYVKIVYKGI